MKRVLSTLAVVGLTVMLAGCHVFKQHPAAGPVAVQVTSQKAVPAVSLQSLDARLKVVESRNARIDARARANKVAQPQ